jgi:hypothetical protein
MSDDGWYNELVDFLESKGYTEDEVAKILDQVKQYDLQTQHDSVMDSLDGGGFDLDAIIQDALKDS